MPDPIRPPADLTRAWTTVVGEVDPLTALRAARDLKDHLAEWEADLARQALAAGETWDTIGTALGISRQAAWERLRPRIAAAIDADRARIRSKRARVQAERGTKWTTKNAATKNTPTQSAAGLNRADQLAARARDLAARAEQVSRQAAEAAESEDTLAQLERELADLDEEERKLDGEFQDLLAEQSDFGRTHQEESAREEDRVTGWADRLSERMESIGARIGDAVSAALAAKPFVSSDTMEREVEVDGALPVSVDSFAGKVNVHAGDDNRVHVVAKRHGWTDADRDGITVDVERDDRGVTVRCRTERTHGHRWVSLDVTVPKTSPTSVKTLGGAVKVEGIGGPVTAETKGGAIWIGGGVGPVRAETLGGPVLVTDHDGPVVARTKGGPVRLSGRLTGGVDADTMGGPVRIEGVDGPVRAQTMGGSVSVTGRLSGECSLSTVGGSVSVGLAPGSNVTVDAVGTSSSTDVPGLRASRGRVEGTVGDGSGGTLSLRTSGGSVRVHTG